MDATKIQYNCCNINRPRKSGKIHELFKSRHPQKNSPNHCAVGQMNHVHMYGGTQWYYTV